MSLAFRATPIRLPLVEPISTAHGPMRDREGLLLEARLDDGASGFGEATPAPGFASPAAFERAARACARLDAEARAAGERLCDRLARACGRRASRQVIVSRLLVGTGETLAEDARRAYDAGYRTLKVKLDGTRPGDPAAPVAALRRALPQAVRVRVDANQSLDPAQALGICKALADLDVELLEEPLAGSDPAALARLRAHGGVPVALDESICDPRAARRALEAGAADILVLKPSALGLETCLQLAALAEAHEARVVVTTALDGAIARAAALHLAAALPDTGLAAGLATGDRLADDLARLPAPEDGALRVPAGPGLGLCPDLVAVERLRSGPDRTGRR